MAILAPVEAVFCNIDIMPYFLFFFIFLNLAFIKVRIQTIRQETSVHSQKNTKVFAIPSSDYDGEKYSYVVHILSSRHLAAQN